MVFPEISSLPNHNGFWYVRAWAAFGFSGMILISANQDKNFLISNDIGLSSNLYELYSVRLLAQSLSFLRLLYSAINRTKNISVVMDIAKDGVQRNDSFITDQNIVPSL